jgi:transcriptional regulator with XRE-family HTH domain
MNIDTRWFQTRLADRHVSQRQLAKRLGLDPAAVSLMLHGRRKFTAKEAVEIARVLGVELEAVVTKAGLGRGVGGLLRGSGEGAPEGGGETGVGRGEKGAAEDEGIEVPAEVFEVPVPLADGGVVRLPLPRKLGRGDAERIAAVVRAWAGTGTATDGNGEKK